MEQWLKVFTVLLSVLAALVLTNCGGSSSGYIGYGVYHGYDYPYYRYRPYYDDDTDAHVDRDAVQERGQQRIETRPQRQQNIQAARSRAAAMGRPVRMGGGRGRR